MDQDKFCARRIKNYIGSELVVCIVGEFNYIWFQKARSVLYMEKVYYTISFTGDKPLPSPNGRLLHTVEKSKITRLS